MKWILALPGKMIRAIGIGHTIAAVVWGVSTSCITFIGANYSALDTFYWGIGIPLIGVGVFITHGLIRNDELF